MLTLPVKICVSVDNIVLPIFSGPLCRLARF